MSSTFKGVFQKCKRGMIQISEKRQLPKSEPDPWLVKKAAVGLVVIFFFYSYYVFVVRLCIPMVRMDDSRLGDRAQGVLYLAIYHVLFIMFIWSYTITIFTSPGYAKNFVPQTDPPRVKEQLVQVDGYRFDSRPNSTKLTPKVHGVPEANEDDGDTIIDRSHDDIGTETISRLSSESNSHIQRHVSLDSGPSSPSTSSIKRGPKFSPVTLPASGDVPLIPIPIPREAFPSKPNSVRLPPTTSQNSPRIDTEAVAHRQSTQSTRSYMNFPPPPEGYEPERGKIVIDRVPNTNPVLTEMYRYDYAESFLRPYRSHKCRHCAKVVLKMDHHCPWVGACVGALNYKYFYNFLTWAVSYTVFLFMTMLIAVIRNRPAKPPLDPQHLCVIILDSVFLIFTGTLLADHTRMILSNLTTLESYHCGKMQQDENRVLNKTYGTYSFFKKREQRKKWDQEWGRIGKEGNLWWLGSKRANWEMVMGKEKIPWFLPIPARPQGDDGLSYAPNPRFSAEGVWRKRSQWPKELQ